jgi:hypothetical protein
MQDPSPLVWSIIYGIMAVASHLLIMPFDPKVSDRQTGQSPTTVEQEATGLLLCNAKFFAL